jgi:hypothetical protein
MAVNGDLRILLGGPETALWEASYVRAQAVDGSISSLNLDEWYTKTGVDWLAKTLSRHSSAPFDGISFTSTVAVPRAATSTLAANFSILRHSSSSFNPTFAVDTDFARNSGGWLG